MQILVVVATIQTRQCAIFKIAHDALKAVVEKVSSQLENIRGLVGPKPRGNPVLNGERESG